MTPGRERAWLAAILIGSAALFLLGIGWGLPSARGWDFDEITPNIVLSSLELGVAKGWLVKYPPLQFYLLAPFYVAAKALAASRLGLPAGAELYTVLFYVSRGASVVMGVLTVLFSYLAARRLVGARAALYGACVVSFCVPMVFYAKLGNLDVPYLFWMSLSYLLLLRLLERHRPVDYLLVAVTAAAAVATKDQAYGVYVLAPLVIVPSLLRHRRESGVRSPLAGLFVDRRVWIALVGGAAAFAVAHGLLGGTGPFMAHYRKITGGYSAGYQMFPQTLAGHWQNFELTVRNVAFSFGWPLLVACLAGIALAFAQPKAERSPRLAVPLVLAASYYVTFVSVILYQYDRYFLPWAVLLAPFGGLALERLAEWRRLPRAAGTALVAGVLVYSGARALTLDLHMLRDARQQAERWLAARVAPGELVLGVGEAKMLPRLEHTVNWQTALRNGARFVAGAKADWLVINGLALWERGAQDFRDNLAAGAWPEYELVARIENPLPFDLLDREGITSSLYFVNPPIDIFRRVEDADPAPAAD